jgi:HSP20 family protein
MTNVVRWDPFAEFRKMDRFFDDAWVQPGRAAPYGRYATAFPVEVSETESDIEVKASLPGVKPEEVDVTVHDDVLTIKAERKDTTEEKKRDYYRRELRYGAFQRSLNLPVAVDSDKAEATFENGVLALKLPKSESVRPKQIKVGTANGATS